MVAARRKISRVLIVNRGEIAVRIIRSLRELGIESVVVYAESDRSCLHTRLADFAYPLQGSTAAETYLHLGQIEEALRASQADAVHPGYGFLAENPLLIDLSARCGAVYIGPSSAAIARLGDKIGARALAKSLGVPTVPGSPGALSSLAQCHEVVRQLGFPVIIKAAAGGGGRGMRVVRSDDELAAAYTSCSREAQAYFGDPTLFCERYLDHPRHIEMQILCDRYGKGIYLLERDCSIQRRHQKLCEEAPSIYLSAAQRQKMGSLAVALALEAGFVGAGTMEFICESPERWYFMEMNPRIQVEHPITEMITGVDIVAEQVRIAEGQGLTLQQDDIRPHGYALEARINAEDPRSGFVPTSGRITSVKLPAGPFTRVDSHIYPGYEVPTQFDSLLAKICVWGSDREAARRRMLRCLSELELRGPATTTVFHEALLAHPRWQRGEFSTNFLSEEDQYFAEWYRASGAGEDGNETMLAGFLPQWQQQQQFQPVLAPHESSWQSQARQRAQERM